VVSSAARIAVVGIAVSGIAVAAGHGPPKLTPMVLTRPDHRYREHDFLIASRFILPTETLTDLRRESSGRALATELR
jgi:hypothetical protein